MKKPQVQPAAGGSNSNSAKPVNLFLLLSFALFLVFITSFKISGDDDIFWHLATGRYIVETKTVPSADIFGYVTAGQQWIPFEWSWDVLNYLVYTISGFAGISILRTLVFMVMFYFLFKLLQRIKVSIPIFIIVSTLLVFGIIDRLLPKPQIISYLFFTILLYLIIEYRNSRKVNHRFLYYIPVLFVIWTNMHMGVLLGSVILALFVISELLLFFIPKKLSTKEMQAPSKSDLKRVLLVFLLSLAALLINPFGFKTYTYVYTHLNMRMLEQVFEWYSPFNRVFEGSIFFYVYLVFAGASLLILYYSFRKMDVFAGILILVFLVFSTRAARYSLDYMVISAPFFAISLDYLLSKLKNKSILAYLTNKRGIKIALALILLAISAAIMSDPLYKFLNYTRSSGFGIDNRDYPVKMFEFIKQNDIDKTGDRVFNSFDCGGYLIWELPGEKNFIDSRNLNDEIFYNYSVINEKAKGFEKKINEYDIEYIIWFYSNLVNDPDEMQRTLIPYLIGKNDEWKLVYWDDNSFLFVKNISKFKDIISKYEYKIVNPYYYAFEREPLLKAYNENRQLVFEEIKRKMRTDPEGEFTNSFVKTFKINAGK